MTIKDMVCGPSLSNGSGNDTGNEENSRPDSNPVVRQETEVPPTSACTPSSTKDASVNEVPRSNVSERAEDTESGTPSSSGLEQSLRETGIRGEMVASETHENAENMETADDNFQLPVIELNGVDEALDNDKNNDTSHEDKSKQPERQTRFSKRRRMPITMDSKRLHSSNANKEQRIPKNVDKNGTNSKPRVQKPSSKPASTIKKKRFECGECKKAFKDNYHLTRHVNGVHRGLSQEKNFECDVCGAAFRDRNGLKRHQPVHDKSRVKRLACKYCKAKFGRQDHLDRHQRKFHFSSLPKKDQRKYKKWTCKVCKVPFGCGTDLADHLEYHAGRKKFPCDGCKLKFESNALLRLHLKAFHNKMGEFRCKRCGKYFTTPSGLSKHNNKKHSGGKK